jgi:hypothetical protein
MYRQHARARVEQIQAIWGMGLYSAGNILMETKLGRNHESMVRGPHQPVVNSSPQLRTLPSISPTARTFPSTFPVRRHLLRTCCVPKGQNSWGDRDEEERGRRRRKKKVCPANQQRQLEKLSWG